MPRFSVIVPAFRVQAYLGECLASVLGQSYRDFELIGVDDASPDGCGEIFDEFAARDSRVKVLHLPENVGLGRARNAGIEVATGDYLLFLDSDDTLTPGSLQALADRLDTVGDPDVLIYDYARTYWDGRVVRSQDAGKFKPGPDRPEVFEISQRQDLLTLLMVVWNKAYKRTFVDSYGFRFPAGYYEDAPWTYPTLLAADSVAVLDRVLVHYRQRREGGNILATRSRKHFDIFDQYDLIFDFLDKHSLEKHGELGHWRPLMYARMVDHLQTIGNHPDRLPTADRAEFFARAAAEERKHRPDGVTALQVTDRGSWRVGSLGRAVRRARRLARRTRPGLRAAVATPVLGGYQRVQRALPVDENLAVFASYWSRTPACNPAAIHAKLRELAPGMKTVWVVKEDRRAGAPEGMTFVGPGSRAYYEAVSRAKYFVNNVNFPDNVPKRPGTVHLQTHHGTPVKKMGIDLQDYPAAGAEMDFGKLLQRVDRWDYSLSANRFSTLVWERVYPSSFRSLEYGYPRNDVYYRASAEDVREARAELGIPDGTVALLYAPTMRDYRSSYRPQLDLARLARTLGPGYVLLNRAHYLYDESGAAPVAAPGVIDVSGHPSVERLGLAADALVTDYSSVMFDYANLDRPIIVLADDWEVYQQTRGVYLDLLSGRPGETPGAVARTEDELSALLLDGSWRSPEAAELRTAFRERFCQFDDGNAAERVVRTVFLGEREPLPVVPVADRTPAPTPEQAARR